MYCWVRSSTLQGQSWFPQRKRIPVASLTLIFTGSSCDPIYADRTVRKSLPVVQMFMSVKGPFGVRKKVSNTPHIHRTTWCSVTVSVKRFSTKNWFCHFHLILSGPKVKMRVSNSQGICCSTYIGSSFLLNLLPTLSKEVGRSTQWLQQWTEVFQSPFSTQAHVYIESSLPGCCRLVVSCTLSLSFQSDIPAPTPRP